MNEVVSEVANVRASKTRGDVGLAGIGGGNLLGELGERIAGGQGLSLGRRLQNHLATGAVTEDRITPPSLSGDDAFEEEGRAGLGPAESCIGRHRRQAVRHQGQGGNGRHGASQGSVTSDRAPDAKLRRPRMTARVHPAIALTVYAEELVSGARAAIFGNATLGLAEELAERGARLVHVYDTDATRVAEATAKRQDRTIFYAPLPESGDVGVRDGAFDLVIVPDLSLADDAGALLALVRRVLSPAGAALIASPNTEASRPLIAIPKPRAALGYYELYEAVAAHFTTVRMIGQAPFVGYAVAEFSVEDPEPTIDSSLAESEGKEPDWFWALASDRNVRLEPFALIELPRCRGR